jgi:hypothetical protein
MKMIEMLLKETVVLINGYHFDCLLILPADSTRKLEVRGVRQLYSGQNGSVLT